MNEWSKGLLTSKKYVDRYIVFIIMEILNFRVNTDIASDLFYASVCMLFEHLYHYFQKKSLRYYYYLVQAHLLKIVTKQLFAYVVAEPF